MPPEIRIAVRDLGYGVLQTLGEKYLEPMEPEFVLGQALAFALLEADRRLDDPSWPLTQPSNPGLSAEEVRRVHRWVRDSMTYCRQESIFRGVLDVYANSLAYNTLEKVHRQLQMIAPVVHQKALGKLESLAEAVGDSWSAIDEIEALGKIMGSVLEGTTLGLLIYGRVRGVISDQELEEVGIPNQALEEQHQFLLLSQDLDLKRIKGNHARDLVERHRELEGIYWELRHRWGQAHPFVSGFEKTFFVESAPGVDIDHLEGLVEGVELYLTGERH